jgi:cell division protein FtsI/penicillin-binding protein 2
MVHGRNKLADRMLTQPDARIRLVSLVIFLFGLLLIFRLFNLQVLQHEFYSLTASETQEVYRNLFPDRGSIYVREDGQLYPLVANRDYYLLYAEPNKITSPNEVIDTITPILGLAKDEWQPLLQRLADYKDPYEPIRHKVTEEQREKIEAAGLAGLGFIPESYRYYPEKNFGSHIFGFLGVSGDQRQGQYGLEGYFEKELAGQSGLLKSAKDALGALITIGPRSLDPAEDGIDLVLTIDRRIQFTICQKLHDFYQSYQAERGSVVIMEPNTGAIIAMCSFPDFDPEHYNEIEDINYFNNPVTFYDYEPGSVFKTITMAAALDQGKIEPDTTYEDTGEVKVGPYTIRNFDQQAYGTQTMTNALEQSLNLGAMFAAEQTGKRQFVNYVKAFGFGESTEIELDSEVSGDTSNLDRRGDIFYLTSSYGQGLTVTPIQLLAAYGAVANDGVLVRPYIVAEKIEPDGTSIATKPQNVRQVISAKTATILTGMLTSVVESSYDRKARVGGYYLAAKTGTAQVAAPTGGYGQETIHTIVGFRPDHKSSFCHAG